MTAHPDATWSLDEDERRVFRLLEDLCRGQAQTMPRVRLAFMADLTTRELEKVVGRLVRHHGIPICSSSAVGRNGYWLPATDDEVAAGRANLMGRIRYLALRLRALDAAATREFTRQLAMEME